MSSQPAPPSSRGHLIIIGASARAAAQSAIRAGYWPWCIDLFADRDLRAIAPVKKCPREKWPQGVLELMHDAPPGPVLLTGAMENHLAIVESLTKGRPMLGPSVGAIRAARDPQLWRRMPPIKGVRTDHFDVPAGERRKTLVKSFRSAGGAGIRRWRGEALKEGEYLQRYVPCAQALGTMCFADDDGARVLGVAEIWNNQWRGGHAYRYIGGVFPFCPWICSGTTLTTIPTSMEYALSCLVPWVSRECGLRGLFGVDFMLADHAIWPLEINPRYPANAELIERVLGISVLSGRGSTATPKRFAGKRIVYASRPLEAPDLYRWFKDREIADVPDVGQRIAPGQPVATVLAEATGSYDCYSRLEKAARKLYTRLMNSWVRT